VLVQFLVNRRAIRAAEHGTSSEERAESPVASEQ